LLNVTDQKQLVYPTSYYIALGTNIGNYRNNLSRALVELGKIGIAVNPENFNIKYLRNIKNIVNIIYYDLNVYKPNSIKTYALAKCLKQIQTIKNLSIPVFIGGGIDEEKANKIINLLNPEGIDVSRNLKNAKNIISSKKLKNFLQQVAVA
jgi:phosphoribosylanthranilate isomerase